MEAHTTSDDPTRYRTEDELERWGQLDPIARMEKLLRARDLYDDDFRQQVEDEAQQQQRHVRAEIYDAPHGDPLELFEHVYVEPPPIYERQRAQLAAELDAATEV